MWFADGRRPEWGVPCMLAGNLIQEKSGLFGGYFLDVLQLIDFMDYSV